jgi:hypothetical protein
MWEDALTNCLRGGETPPVLPTGRVEMESLLCIRREQEFVGRR